jgi:surface antigen
MRADSGLRLTSLIIQRAVHFVVGATLVGLVHAAVADPYDGYKQQYERKREYSEAEYKFEENGPGYKHEYKRDKHKHGHREDYQGKGGPPPWAPAHGYRAKHGHQHAGHTNYDDGHPDDHRDHLELEEELGILNGTCNREAIGVLLGGVVGGAVGSKVGKGDGRKVAIVAGTVLGAVVGSRIGRTMDEADQQCTGQVLERAPDGQSVVWRNSETRAQYAVTPVRTYEQRGHYCRDFLAEAAQGASPQQAWGTACRTSDGRWQMTDASF